MFHFKYLRPGLPVVSPGPYGSGRFFFHSSMAALPRFETPPRQPCLAVQRLAVLVPSALGERPTAAATNESASDLN